MSQPPSWETVPAPNEAAALARASHEHLRDAAVEALVQEWADVVPGIDGEVRSIAARIARISDHLRSGAGRILEELGLNDNEFRLLAGLMRIGPPHYCPPGELAGRYVPVTSGGMTGIINRLESRRLIARLPHARDGRSFQLQLTPEGEACARSAMERLAAMEAVAMSRLDASARAAGNAFLGSLLRSIEATITFTEAQAPGSS